jgi:MazG family protein
MSNQTFRRMLPCWRPHMSSPPIDAPAKFLELVQIMERLRRPDGCPWDLKQTFDTIKPYLLEETYEVMDAIDRRDWPHLAEELGDLMLQPVFFAQMASEQDLFTISDSLDAINQKLIRRHPHVFGDATAETAEDVKSRWDQIKRQEKVEKGTAPEQASVLDEIPRTVPALVEALKISKRAASTGFEWPDVTGVVDKVHEEVRELTEARELMRHDQIEHELGDLLFTIVNLARFLNVDPEQALRKTNVRFRSRFGHIEHELAAAGEELKGTSLERLEELWQAAKRQEKRVDDGNSQAEQAS